jgi:hypothetical protein
VIGNLKGFALFFSPLLYFVLGILSLACSTISYPAIAGAVSGTKAEMASNGVAEANYRGLSWALASTRFLIFASGLLFLVIGVGITWIKRKLNTRA